MAASTKLTDWGLPDDELYERMRRAAESLPPAKGDPFINEADVTTMRGALEVVDALGRYQAICMSRETFEWMVDYITRLRAATDVILRPDPDGLL